MSPVSPAIRAGSKLKLSDGSGTVVVWSAAPGPGCYWCHWREQGDRMVLVQVRLKPGSISPTIRILEDA